MAIVKGPSISSSTATPPCRPTRPKPPLAPKRPATTRFHFSVYHVGRKHSQRHFTLDDAQLQALEIKDPADCPIAPYALEWALMPHVAGDSLLAIATDPATDPCSVVRYQIIAE